MKLRRIREMKAAGEKIAVLTAYDYPTARLLDEAGIDLLLVGDSLGMVVLGYPDTTHVTLEEILHHTRAVCRAGTRAPVVADLPIHTYDSPAQALANARRLLEAGADAVKLEGGTSHAEQMRAIVADGIELMGHIGMLPQSVHALGGYRIQGKTPAAAEALLADARAVEAAGAFAVVLELVQPEVAARISREIGVPTIGIGSGPECDGQVLVTPDLIGSFPWFRPKFAQPRADVAGEIRQAVAVWRGEVKGGR